MKTLLALLLLIPSLSWGEILTYTCEVEYSPTITKKDDSSIWIKHAPFDMKIHEDRYLIEFNSNHPVGTTFMAIDNRELYDMSKIVKSQEFNGSIFLYFDGSNFTLTRTDVDKVKVIFANCRKIF